LFGEPHGGAIIVDLPPGAIPHNPFIPLGDEANIFAVPTYKPASISQIGVEISFGPACSRWAGRSRNRLFLVNMSRHNDPPLRVYLKMRLTPDASYGRQTLPTLQFCAQSTTPGQVGNP